MKRYTVGGAMTTTGDYYRTRAIEALRTYGQTNAAAISPSRTYWVYDAWKHGECNISYLAELAGVSRNTIYADLAKYDVEVDKDLKTRLARWTEIEGAPTAVSEPSSAYMGIDEGYAYQRTWTCPGKTGGRVGFTLTMWIEKTCRVHGSWRRTEYDAAGDEIDSSRVPMTHERVDVEPRIIAAHKRGLSIEQAINHAVEERLSRALLADLHASYRPSWI
jgi:hypothetical protein